MVDMPLHHCMDIGDILEGSWGHLPRETSKRKPDQMPEPPQLAPLNAEEQRLYSEPLPDIQALQPISKAKPSHPVKEAHLDYLYSRAHTFGHYQELMTKGKRWDVE